MKKNELTTLELHYIHAHNLAKESAKEKNRIMRDYYSKIGGWIALRNYILSKGYPKEKLGKIERLT